MDSQIENGKTCNCSDKKCGCPHHKVAKVAPLGLVIIGLLLIAQAFGFVINMMAWEIILGLLLVVIGWNRIMRGCKCCGGGKCC